MHSLCKGSKEIWAVKLSEKLRLGSITIASAASDQTFAKGTVNGNFASLSEVTDANLNCYFCIFSILGSPAVRDSRDSLF